VAAKACPANFLALRLDCFILVLVSLNVSLNPRWQI